MPSASRIPVAAAVLLSCLTLSACKQPVVPSTQSAPEVAALTLRSQQVTLTRELPGRVRPFLIAEVRPQVDGIVKDRLFAEGGLVEAGQPLYQIDDAIYRAELESARAVAARAEAALHTARLQAGRSAELAAQHLISVQDNDLAQAGLLQAQADLQAAEAEVTRRRIPVDFARIAAPIGGRIGKSTVTAGALVTANQGTPMVTVQRLDPVYVDLSWSSAELLALRQAMADDRLEAVRDVPVDIVLEDGSRYPLPGTTSFADLTVDPGTGSFTMRVEVPNPDDVLLPGMYVRAVISTGMRRDALLVPQQSVTRDARGAASVLTVTDGGEVQRRAVTVGPTLDGNWLVESGLVAGDRVIVEGLQKAEPGAAVQVAEWRPRQERNASGGPAIYAGG